jgi:hypothetical protein
VLVRLRGLDGAAEIAQQAGDGWAKNHEASDGENSNEGNNQTVLDQALCPFACGCKHSDEFSVRLDAVVWSIPRGSLRAASTAIDSRKAGKNAPPDPKQVHSFQIAGVEAVGLPLAVNGLQVLLRGNGARGIGVFARRVDADFG